MEKHREKVSAKSEHKDPMLAELEANGVRIEKMPTTPKSRALDLSGFTSSDRALTALVQKQVADFAEMCERFLAGSVVTDRFETHGERRHFRHEMDAKYGRPFHDILERNMLKLNNLAGIYSYMEFVVSGLDGAGIQSDKASSIRAIAKEMPDISRYENHHQEERIAIVQHYIRLCERYLDIVSVSARRR